MASMQVLFIRLGTLDDCTHSLHTFFSLLLFHPTGLSHTRRQPPTLQELEADRIRRQRLAYNVSLIEARDAEERANQRLLSSPTESAEFDPHARSEQSPMGGQMHSADQIPETSAPDPAASQDRPFDQRQYETPSQLAPHDIPSQHALYDTPSKYTPPSKRTSTSPSTSHSARHHDPNAPVDTSLRARSQREMETSRRKMEMGKSPLEGYTPISPAQAGRAGRVESDTTKVEDQSGVNSDEQARPAETVIPKPKRRGTRS